MLASFSALFFWIALVMEPVMKMIINIPIDTWYHIRKKHKFNELSDADKNILIETIYKAEPIEEERLQNE